MYFIFNLKFLYRLEAIFAIKNLKRAWRSRVWDGRKGSGGGGLNREDFSSSPLTGLVFVPDNNPILGFQVFRSVDLLIKVGV